MQLHFKIIILQMHLGNNVCVYLQYVERVLFLFFYAKCTFFIVHFFSKDKINQLSKGFEILDIEKFEEGEFPRKLFRVTLKKKLLTG